jgi:4a-hydroxytetrahydrobiopterin dehydratase
MERLPEPEIETNLAELEGHWRRDGEQIVADLECENFAAAIELVNRIAAEAERADHHPDILVHGYKHLRITLSTHAAGGLTERDFALARTLDTL